MATGGAPPPETETSISDAPVNSKREFVNRLKITLKQEGYDYAFVDRLRSREYECMICLCVARSPSLTPCSHLTCISCWENWKCKQEANGEVICCPVCLVPIGDRPVEQSQWINRIVQNMLVYCVNRKHGCQQTVEVAYIEEHQTNCGFQYVSCDQFCSQKILLNTLAIHMEDSCPRRPLDCNRCEKKMLYEDIEEHENVCPLKFAICTYCEMNTLRNYQIAEHHKNECTMYPTFCSYALIGCNEKVTRNNLLCHHKTSVPKHMDLLNSALYKFSESLGLPPIIDTSKLATGQSELPACLWRRVNQTTDNLDWNELPVGLCDINKSCNNNVLDRIDKLEKEVKKTKLENKLQKDIIRTLTKDIDVQNTLIVNETKNLTQKIDVLCRKTQIFNNNFNFLSAHNPHKIFESGKFIWETYFDTDITKSSSPFYSRGKYKFILRIQFKEVVLYLMKGEYDDELTWPFLGKQVNLKFKDERENCFAPTASNSLIYTTSQIKYGGVNFVVRWFITQHSRENIKIIADF